MEAACGREESRPILLLLLLLHLKLVLGQRCLLLLEYPASPSTRVLRLVVEKLRVLRCGGVVGVAHHVRRWWHLGGHHAGVMMLLATSAHVNIVANVKSLAATGGMHGHRAAYLRLLEVAGRSLIVGHH